MQWTTFQGLSFLFPSLSHFYKKNVTIITPVWSVLHTLVPLPPLDWALHNYGQKKISNRISLRLRKNAQQAFGMQFSGITNKKQLSPKEWKLLSFYYTKETSSVTQNRCKTCTCVRGSLTRGENLTSLVTCCCMQSILTQQWCLLEPQMKDCTPFQMHDGTCHEILHTPSSERNKAKIC